MTSRFRNISMDWKNEENSDFTFFFFEKSRELNLNDAAVVINMIEFDVDADEYVPELELMQASPDDAV